MKHRLLLLGTGTEVGKTHLGEALAAALVTRGERVAALKLVETGAGGGLTDAARLASAAAFHVKHACYEFTEPVSPHLAARRMGVRIDLEHLRHWTLRHDAPWQVCETAGGLLSPLSAAHTNLDLATHLEPTAALLVGPDRLGVLHDVSVCVAAVRTLAPLLLDRLHVALSAPATPDASSGTNGPELERLGVADRVHWFPRCEPTGEPSQRAARELLDRLRSGA